MWLIESGMWLIDRKDVLDVRGTQSIQDYKHWEEDFKVHPIGDR